MTFTTAPVKPQRKVRCALCGANIAQRLAWRVPSWSAEFYCAAHWSEGAGTPTARRHRRDHDEPEWRNT
jgi:hypothetical protein